MEEAASGTHRCPRCRGVVPDAAETCPACGADTRVVVDVEAGVDMPRIGPSRLRPHRGWWAAAAAATAWLLLWAVGSAGREAAPPPPPPPAASEPAALPAGAVPPVRLPNGWICPTGSQYAAYDADSRYYPPNHPGFPRPDVRPAACFPSTAEPRSAGFTEVPAPPGSETVEGVYLVPTDPEAVRADCAGAAESLGYPVPCPQRLPNPPRWVPSPRCADVSPAQAALPPCVFGSWFVFDYPGYAAPVTEGSAGTAASHLAIAASRDVRFRHAGPVSPLGCAGELVIDTVLLPLRLAGGIERAALIACPAGSRDPATRVLLRWSRGGVVYEVTLWNDTPANRRLVVAIASAIVYTPPPVDPA